VWSRIEVYYNEGSGRFQARVYTEKQYSNTNNTIMFHSKIIYFKPDYPDMKHNKKQYTINIPYKGQ